MFHAKGMHPQSTVRIDEAKLRQHVRMRCLGTAVPIMFAADRSGVTFGMAPDSTHAAESAEALRAVVAMDSIMAADAAHCFPPCAQSLGLSHMALNRSASQRARGRITSGRSATGRVASGRSCPDSATWRRNISETACYGSSSPASARPQAFHPASEPPLMRRA